MSVKRLTYKEVLNKSLSELKSMSDKDFARAVRSVGDVVNKRIKRFEESGIYSSAVAHLKNTGDDRIRTGGKSRGELEEELFRAKTFLSTEDSSLNFISKLRKKVEKTTKTRKNRNEPLELTDRETAKMWNVWENYKDTHTVDSSEGSPSEVYIYKDIVLEYKQANRRTPSAKWLKQELDNIFGGKYIWDGHKAVLSESWTDKYGVYEYEEFNLLK